MRIGVGRKKLRMGDLLVAAGTDVTEGERTEVRKNTCRRGVHQSGASDCGIDTAVRSGIH